MSGKIKSSLFIVLLILTVAFPFMAGAQGQNSPSTIVNCTGVSGSNPCTWNSLVGPAGLIHNIIYFALFSLAVPVAVIALVWAGIMMVTKPGAPDTKTRVRAIILSVILGLILALAGYLIIKAILVGLNSGNKFNLNNTFQ